MTCARSSPDLAMHAADTIETRSELKRFNAAGQLDDLCQTREQHSATPPPRAGTNVRGRGHASDDISLIVCVDARDDDKPLLVRPAPIHVPPVADRAKDLPRIVNGYALDA